LVPLLTMLLVPPLNPAAGELIIILITSLTSL
jgi:hypothetical protein